ncbi:fimbrial protein [Serratia sp. JSRIV001]|jgi:major type 1 subunit fimbrin (pilin)|uniref:fimbrial protein n=1 Tax=Serratia TaxID=613 RepID=UPI0003AF2181|nr:MULTISPECIES: fimbrial protein [Serratia]ERK11903.1 Fimbrial protein [Serratia fonticola AU-AP2C]ALX96570.1 fimbrial protein [Serratia fonticola]MBP1016492.1 fimbrial protein [Serratia fonticola]MBP1036195.1 fimbrial protein [Serratia fonticola]NYA43966.1 fimbrial protein [Serratia fonticola]
MNKNLLAVAVLAASAFSTAAFAADGKVNFAGEIIDQACTVHSDSENQTVTLGKVFVGAFKGGAGVTAASKDFSLILQDCPDTVKAATVRFDGIQVAGNDAVLALTDEPGVATGVGVQIADNNNKVINLHTDSSVYPLSSTEDNVLGFVARYYATSATVTAGKANAVSNFTIIYQ